MIQDWKRSVGAAFLFCALAAVLSLSQRAMDAERRITFEDRSPQFLPNGEVLRWLSLGHRATLADALWIKSVLYYGRRVMDEDNPYFTYRDSGATVQSAPLPRTTFLPDTVPGMDSSLLPVLFRMEGRGLVDYIYPLLDRVTTLDPHFITPYVFGGVSVLMDTGELDKAEALLKKGWRANPDEWRFPFYLGWLAWMYQGNAREAHRLMLEASPLPGCPAFVSDLIAGLTGKLNRRELTVRYLEGMLESTESEDIREQLQGVLQRLKE